MALGGICAAARLDGSPPGDAPSPADTVHRMSRGVAWRAAGGVSVVELAGTALGSTLPAGAGTEARTGWAASRAVAVVADARLLARHELRAELGAVSAATSSGEPTDAELILAAYREWGDDCPDHLLGEFAFALWDDERRALLCARDPIGARPLCYSFDADGGSFRAASSPLQILAAGDVSDDLDGVALTDLLAAHFHDPERTAFAAIRNVPPGCILSVGAGGSTRRRYWRPEPAGEDSRRSRPAEVWVEEMRTVLSAVVADHLGDALPAAAVMTSGGLDSSSVAAFAHALWRRGATTAPPIAFVDVFERLTGCDEWRHASVLQDELGLEMERVVADDASDLVPDPSWTEPAAGPVELSGELVARALDRARTRGCRTVATGFGGDTLFDAARWQPYDYVRGGRWLRALPWVAGAHARGASWPRAAASVLLSPLLTAAGRRRLDRLRSTGRYWQSPPWLREAPRSLATARRERELWPRRFRSFARQAQYEHLVGLAQQGPAIDLWTAHATRRGIEACHPLLDRRLAELALRAPIELGARPGPAGSKWLLREAGAGVVPERIRCRADKGSWAELTRDTICRRLAAEARELFAGSRLAELGLVDDDRLLAAWRAWCGKPAQAPRMHGQLLGFAYLVERWLRSQAAETCSVRFEGGTETGRAWYAV